MAILAWDSTAFDDRRALLRRHENRRVGDRNNVVFLAGARKEIVARAELDPADAHDSGKYDNFLGTLVGVAGKPGSLRQPHDRRAAAGFVGAKKAALDSIVIGGLPFAIGGFVEY